MELKYSHSSTPKKEVISIRENKKQKNILEPEQE